MTSSLRKSLSGVDLSTLDLDSVDNLDPQMVRVLKSVKRWSTETVAHQNHTSHGDTHNQRPIEREELLLKR